MKSFLEKTIDRLRIGGDVSRAHPPGPRGDTAMPPPRPRPSMLSAAAVLCLLPSFGWFNPVFFETAQGWFLLGLFLILLTWLVGILGSLRSERMAWVLTHAWFVALTAFLGGVAFGAPGALVSGSFSAMLFQGARAYRPITRFWLAASLTGAVCFGAVFWALPLRADVRVVVIGVDGATWAIIDDLRAEKRLPTFDRLLESGVRGELEVTPPTISPVLWTTIATGVSPKRHGVVDFWGSSRQVRAKRFWEIADEYGMSTGVFGYLMTWPPEKGDGFLVPGWLAQGEETIPPTLRFLKEIEGLEHATRPVSLGTRTLWAWDSLGQGGTANSTWGLIRVMSRPEQSLVRGRSHDLDRRVASTGLWADTFCHQLRRGQPDLAVFYQHHVDAVEHLFFAYHEPRESDRFSPSDLAEYGPAIPRIYEATDAALERISGCVSEKTDLIVLSDHGQQRGGSSAFPMVNSTTLLELLDLDEEVRATNIGALVLLRSIDPSFDFKPAIAKLQQVQFLPRGGPAFDVRLRPEGGATLSPRFSFYGAESMQVGGHVVSVETILDRSDRISGTHTNRAIILLAGPSFDPGASLRASTLLDIAPTTLALLRLPLAEDLEGRVLKEAFVPGVQSDLSQEFVQTYGERDFDQDSGPTEMDEKIKRKLKALGYVQ